MSVQIILALAAWKGGSPILNTLLSLVSSPVIAIPETDSYILPGFQALTASGGRKPIGIRAVKSLQVMPRAWLVRRLTVVQGRKRVLAALADPGFRPDSTLSPAQLSPEARATYHGLEPLLTSTLQLQYLGLSSDSLRAEWPLETTLARDLVAAIQRTIETRLDLSVTVEGADDDITGPGCRSRDPGAGRGNPTGVLESGYLGSPPQFSSMQSSPLTPSIWHEVLV
jgi:hypothetical protein